jgi:hypothetical protein
VDREAPEHAAKWQLCHRLGKDSVDVYEPTITVPAGQFVDRINAAPNGMHGVSILIDLGIEGYLFKTEALKLYKIATHCEGNVLEVDTHKGLSTSIIAQALHDRGHGCLETIELKPFFSAQATSTSARFLAASASASSWRMRPMEWTISSAMAACTASSLLTIGTDTMPPMTQ